VDDSQCGSITKLTKKNRIKIGNVPGSSKIMTYKFTGTPPDHFRLDWNMITFWGGGGWDYHLANKSNNYGAFTLDVKSVSNENLDGILSGIQC